MDRTIPFIITAFVLAAIIMFFSIKQGGGKIHLDFRTPSGQPSHIVK